ncbi:hypothetical protein HYV12_01920 [Candidatus Dojkabacteria bacterium]|nr:hypothetical protein [Candidatus Dojkabacteria bacterium]
MEPNSPQPTVNQSVPPQVQPEVSHSIPTPILPTVTPPPEITPTKKRTSLLIPLVIFGILLLVAGIAYYFLMSKPRANSDKDKGKDVAFITPEVKYNNIAYLDISQGSEADNPKSLVIYNTETKEKQTAFPKLNFAKDTSISIGKWSPSGQYLPIVTSSFINGSYQEGESYFFFYDSATKDLIQAIHVPHNNTLENRWMDTGYLETTGSWINETDFLISMEPKETSTYSELSIKYLNVSGELKEYSVTADTNSPVKKGIQNLYKSNVSSFKSRSTGTSVSYYDFKYRNISYKLLSSEDEPKGVLNGNLITLYTPKGINLLSDSAELDQIEGETPEEQLTRAIDLLYPKGKDTLIFSDIDGKRVKEIALPYEEWRSDEVIVNDDENYIIAHQSERTISPTKVRYLKVSEDGTVEILYEGIPSTLILEPRIRLSQNRDSLLVPTGPSSYSFINLVTKANSVICEKCTNLQINNPWISRIVY